MKHIKRILPLFICSLFFIACSNDEGEGGRSTVEGFVYKIKVNDDLSRDTFPANDQRVQILYGGQGAGDDSRTYPDGFYKFSYLREGNYTIVAYTELPSGQNIPVTQTLRVSGNKSTYVAPDIYIEDGKAVETYYAAGKLMVEWYQKRSTILRVDSLPGAGVRVYINKESDITFQDDIRANEDGTFVFSRLTPDKYRVWTIFENPNETESTVGIDFEINKEGKILIDDEIVPDLGVLVTRLNI